MEGRLLARAKSAEVACSAARDAERTALGLVSTLTRSSIQELPCRLLC